MPILRVGALFQACSGAKQAVADLEPGHIVTNCRHLACELVARYRLRRLAEQTNHHLGYLAEHDVAPGDAGRVNPDQHLVRFWSRLGDIGQNEPVWRSRPLQQDGLHDGRLLV